MVVVINGCSSGSLDLILLFAYEIFSVGFSVQPTATVRPGGVAEARGAGGDAGKLEGRTSDTQRRSRWK